ncbi:hypothetical protein D3C80_1748910 [compost metagenome]
MFHRFGQVQHRFDARIDPGEQLAQLGEVVFLELDLQRQLQCLLLFGPGRQPLRRQVRLA